MVIVVFIILYFYDIIYLYINAFIFKVFVT